MSQRFRPSCSTLTNARRSASPPARLRWSDRMAGGFGGVLAAGGSSPPDGAVGQLIDVPPRVLLDPMVVPALRVAITQAAAAARLERDVVLKVRLRGRAPAGRAGTGGVPDLG